MRVVLSVMALTVVMMHFQNCAPAGVEESAPIGSDTVRIVDDYASQKINLLENVVEGTEAISVDGFCDRHMTGLDELIWEVRDPGGAGAVIAGQVACERGGFRFQIGDVSELACDVAYELQVRSVHGDADIAAIIRRCAL